MWSKDNQRFEKQYCLNFSYGGGEVNVEYAAWNSKDNAYTDVKTKAVYQINGMGVNYQSYEWNKKESSWNLMVEHSTQPEEILLSCEEVAGSTIIKVRDNGIGIPLKEQWKKSFCLQRNK